MATAAVVVPWQPWRAWRTTALWTATAHLAIGVVFTSVCAALVVTGVAVGALVLITAGAGVVWRLGTPMMAGLGSAERARFQIMLGVHIDGTDGALSSIRYGVRYWCIRLPVSLLDLVGLLVAWVVPVGAMSVPIVVRSYGTSWVAFGCGLAALLFVSPVVTRLLLDVDIALATRLLGPRPDDLRTRVRSLETSRAAVVAADDRERRRIERDLHDGAQQRLVALTMVLGHAQRRLGDDADPAIRSLLAEAKANAGEAITELRELARGLHPPVLTDRGLDAALSAVAARLPVPVTIHVVTEPRPSPTIEAIAYFVVCEALTNVAKHADATAASVHVVRATDRLHVEIRDDGVGGADMAQGTISPPRSQLCFHRPCSSVGLAALSPSPCWSAVEWSVRLSDPSHAVVYPDPTMTSPRIGLAGLLMAIAAGDHASVTASLDGEPSLATARLARHDEFFVPDHAQVYEGATALHAAAFAYDVEIARDLVARGADVRARDRRGAEPLHAAVIGRPGASTWDPARQRAIIEYLVFAGADPDAAAKGGVTPLHRAVRNRCSDAVRALLLAGADPHRTNDHGSTPGDLARLTTGRGGVGSPEAKIEQRIIVDLLG